MEKVECGRSTAKLPLYNGIKTVYSNGEMVSILIGKSYALGRNSVAQKRNGHTNRQTKNSTFLATPATVKSKPHQIWHAVRPVADADIMFLSCFFLLLFSSPNISSRRLDTSTHGVALVRI